MNNFDFLSSLLTTIPEDVRAISLTGYFSTIVISLIVSLLISGLYIKYFDPNSTGSKIHRSFPLLGPAVTTIFITVQFSLPLSLGLLGALSIVRFRTPIKEPEEIGFILLLIACSISIATFNIAIAAILFMTVFVFLYVFSFFPKFSWLENNSAVISILMPNNEGSGEVDMDNIIEILENQKIKYRITNWHCGDGQASLSIAMKKLSDKDLCVVHKIKSLNDLVSVNLYRK